MKEPIYLTVSDIFMLQIHSSVWAKYFNFGHSVIGAYYMWKSRRIHKRYSESLAMRAIYKEIKNAQL